MGDMRDIKCPSSGICESENGNGVDRTDDTRHIGKETRYFWRTNGRRSVSSSSMSSIDTQIVAMSEQLDIFLQIDWTNEICATQLIKGYSMYAARVYVFFSFSFLFRFQNPNFCYNRVSTTFLEALFKCRLSYYVVIYIAVAIINFVFFCLLKCLHVLWLYWPMVVITVSE